MFGAETGIAGGFVILLALLVAIVFVLYLVPIPLWIAAWASGAYVGLLTLIGMSCLGGQPAQSPAELLLQLKEHPERVAALASPFL